MRLSLREVRCTTLPDNPLDTVVYRLVPNDSDDDYYRERTDRNIGWITRDEQRLLRQSTVGIAGCGGMGGLLTSIFLRLGIGEVRIADCETFDASNINRQAGAGRSTVGMSKAFVTARMAREVTDDTSLVVYPQGITEETAEHFVAGCNIICDEIEFWAVGARILLHQRARAEGITVFNANTVGFGTRLFRFVPDGTTMEEVLCLGYEEARALQERIQTGSASDHDIDQAMAAVLDGLVPELPEYGSDGSFSTVHNANERLKRERRAMIIATNPPMAAGFLADHVLFELLRQKSLTPRRIITPPPAPGYLYFDAGFHEARAVERKLVMP